MAHDEDARTPIEELDPRRPDDTPPRNRVIAMYTMLGVLSLVTLKFLFDSYLDTSRQHVRALHIEGSHTTRTLEDYRQDQRAQLASGGMPIQRAMLEMGRRGRDAFPPIRPQPTRPQDNAALQGWQQLPRELPAVLRPRPEPPAPPAPVEVPGATPGSEMAPPGGPIPPVEGQAPPVEGQAPAAQAPVAPGPEAQAPEAQAPRAPAPEAQAPAAEAAPAQPAAPRPQPAVPAPRRPRPAPAEGEAPPAAPAPAPEPATE